MLETPQKLYGPPYNMDGTLNRAWYEENIIEVELPFPLRPTTALHKTILTVEFHKVAAPSLRQAFCKVFDHARDVVKHHYGYDLTTGFYDEKAKQLLRELSLDCCLETFNFRRKAGSDRYSSHAYGAAINMNPGVYNVYDQKQPTLPRWYIDCFRSSGFQWGGDRRVSPELYHFQACSGI
jgi:hypothetical protein